jgi:hypothetical protein
MNNTHTQTTKDAIEIAALNTELWMNTIRDGQPRLYNSPAFQSINRRASQIAHGQGVSHNDFYAAVRARVAKISTTAYRYESAS